MPLLKDFENGKDGVYTKYEQDFSRLDVNYKGGKKNGPCRIYDAEGKILSEVSYYNDQLAQENHQKSTLKQSLQERSLKQVEMTPVPSKAENQSETPSRQDTKNAIPLKQLQSAGR